MAIVDIKRNRERYDLNVFFNKNSKSHYTNIMDKDAKKLALVFLDLYYEGFPIEKAYKLMKEMIEDKDWLG